MSDTLEEQLKAAKKWNTTLVIWLVVAIGGLGGLCCYTFGESNKVIMDGVAATSTLRAQLDACRSGR